MKKKDLKELKRIHDMIPESLKKRLMINRAVSPTIARITREAMKDPDMSEERRAQFQNIIDSGVIDQKEEDVNKTAQKEIEIFIETEMIKSIRAGRLSAPKDDTLLAKRIKKCQKNTKKSS